MDINRWTGAVLPPRPTIKAAGYHGVDVKAIRRWTAAGRLTAHRVGPRQLRLERDEVLRLGRPVEGAG